MTRLHVIQTIGSIAERSGGPARTVRDLSEALARQGVRVTLLAGHDPARDDGLLPPDPALVTTVMVPVQRQLGLPAFDFTAAMVDKVDDETTIVHDHGIWSPSNIGAGRAARRLGLPLVISPHGMLDPWAMAYKRGRKAIAWRLYQHRLLQLARGLCATAAREAGPMRALMPDKPIALIPNGVACPPSVPDRVARDDAASRTLLYLSRLHPKKNLLTLLEAWAPLAAQPRFAAWTLVIAGPDELGHRAELAARIAKLHLHRSVQLRDAVPESAKTEVFAGADLFILPSLSENFGITVAEALAQGVPAIVSNGAPWESLASERCGWFTGTDVDTLQTAMAEAMALSAAERRAMGVRGHAYIAQDFAWSAIAAKTLDFYQWLRHGGTPPDFVDA